MNMNRRTFLKKIGSAGAAAGSLPLVSSLGSLTSCRNGRGRKHPNILFYLIVNEPHADAVFRSGPENVDAFFDQAVAAGGEATAGSRIFSSFLTWM